DLLEDLGDRTLRDVDGSQQIILYQKACEIVPRLQRLSANAEDIPAFGRIYDRALVRTKAWKWLHWTIPGLLQRPATEQESNSLQQVFESIAGLLDAAPRRFAHRDFKAENLHLVSEAAATAKSPDTTEQIVMIDLQGGFMAPPEYDLVCLLYDLQVELDESFMADCFAKTRMNLPDRCDADLAALRSDALATLRLCKDIAHLVYASRVRKDSRRWHEIPRGLTLLDQTTRRLRSVFPEIQGLQSILPTLTLAFDSLKSPQE
ncbi:MAG: phosphotransferase, partial [Myxococcota bacterium]